MLTPEQIELRLNYLTGSDVGAICEVNPWATPVDVWQIKTRRVVAEDIGHKPAVKAGNMLENAVADWFVAETGKQVKVSEKFYVHKSLSYLGGNIDRFVVGENALLECKTTQSDKGWGAGYTEGDNKIPDSYLCQVIHYCAVTDCDVAYIAVLIRGIDFRWYKYERNLELENIVVQRLCDFWNKHILTDICPQPSTADEVKVALRGRVSNEAITVDDEIAHAIQSLKDTRAQIDALEDLEEELVNKICVYMGDKQTLVNTDGTVAVTWKQRPGTITFDAKKFKEANPEMYSQYERQGKEVRSFLLKQSKDK